MSSTSSIAVTNSQAIKTALSLRKLYLIRAVFSLCWVVLVALFAKTSAEFASILLIIYPAWDLIATVIDIKSNQDAPSKTPQYINAAISALTTLLVALALQKGIPEALIVFGAWAILTGLIQFFLGLRRKKSIGGQWPMIISGGQSILGGASFIVFAYDPTKGIASIAGYAAFGAFYYLLAAFRLNRVIKKNQ